MVLEQRIRQFDLRALHRFMRNKRMVGLVAPWLGRNRQLITVGGFITFVVKSCYIYGQFLSHLYLVLHVWFLLHIHGWYNPWPHQYYYQYCHSHVSITLTTSSLLPAPSPPPSQALQPQQHCHHQQKHLSTVISTVPSLSLMLSSQPSPSPLRWLQTVSST